MHVIVLVLAAMAVGLGALFLLAKVQKENLGKLYSVSGYVVLTISTLVIVFAIAVGILHCCYNHHGGKSCGKYKTESCHKGGKGGSCSMMKRSCGMDEDCSVRSKSCSSVSSHCSKSGMDCMKGGNCMMMKKKVMKTMHGDSVNVDVKVIAE